MPRLPLAVPLILLALPAAAQDATLTLYTSQPNEDAQQTVDAFMAANPDVAVEFVRDGTQIMARLLTEIEAGQAQPDVLLIADAVTMESMEAEGHLLAYPEADVSAYPAGTHDDEGHYFSTKLITTGLIRNTGAPMELTSWADLLSEEAAGQVVMPSPLTSGAALINYATLRGVGALGLDYFEGLAENGALAQGGNGGVFQSARGRREDARHRLRRLPADPRGGRRIAGGVRVPRGGRLGRTERVATWPAPTRPTRRGASSTSC